MNKTVFFAFKGNAMCFIHVLLNALDMNNKGIKCKIVIEGEAVTLLKDLQQNSNPLYMDAKEKGLIDCICKACSVKLGVFEYNETLDIPLKGEMSGHVSMLSYIERGYSVITL